MLQTYRTGCSGVWSPLHHPHHQTHEHRAGREDQEPQQPAVFLQAHRTDLLWRQELLKDGNKPFVSRHSLFRCHSLNVSPRRKSPLTSSPSHPVTDCLYSIACCLELRWSTRRLSSREKKHLEDIDQKDNVNSFFVISLLLYCAN